jgi:hypothetical protein
MPYSYLLSDENDPVILANRSRAFTLAGCFSEALKDANQAIQKNPRMAKVVVLAGLDQSKALTMYQ